MGYGKELKINWSGTVDPALGLKVEVATTTSARITPARGTEMPATINAGRSLDIRYSLDRTSRVSIALFHVNGRKIVDIVNRVEGAGVHNVRWDANANLSHEMCIVAIMAGDKKVIRKVMMLGR